VFGSERSNSRLAKFWNCEFTLVRDQLQGKRNEESGLYGQTLNIHIAMNENEENNLEMNEENNLEKNEKAKADKESLDAKLQDVELINLRIEVNEYKEQLVRTSAEMENQRKRMEREMENVRNFACQNFLSQLLPAKDSMEKGVDVSYMEDGIDSETLLEGIVSTLKICNASFKAAGIEEINPLGKEFNPELHEAMAIKQVEGTKPNVVLSVYQKGYSLNGRLIRPARVEVSAS
jgi:molecular chaperone GrpE